jgi:PhnB protein
MDDVKPFWDRAVAGGAIVNMPLAGMFWSDRYGQVTDPFGHKWSMSQTLHIMSKSEMETAAIQALSANGKLMGDPVAGA